MIRLFSVQCSVLAFNGICNDRDQDQDLSNLGEEVACGYKQSPPGLCGLGVGYLRGLFEIVAMEVVVGSVFLATPLKAQGQIPNPQI